MKRKLWLLLFASGISATGFAANDLKSGIDSVRRFIRTSWDKTVRFHPEDEETRIGLPRPYTVPSVSGMFQEIYYWDTFFTNEGLILDGRTELARNNVENMLFLVERYGKMLNGNRTFYTNRSQSPYLSMMIAAVYDATGDKEWLRGVLPGLEKEYRFWMTERITPIGLNRHGNNATDEEKLGFIPLLQGRLGENFKTEGLSREELLEIGSHYIAEAESWDFNPRYKGRCMDFCPVDLNANLHLYELNFARFYDELGDKGAAKKWRKTAEKRRELIRKYLRDPETGMYYDYDWVAGKRSDVVSGAVFNLLFARAVDKREARGVLAALERLEYPYGIAACEDKPYAYRYQWSYPNGWAPVQYLAVRGLAGYGYMEEARRIAHKYVGIVVRNFRQTGNLWEKYNVAEGNVNVSDEYDMPTMIGWTAGIFEWMLDFLESGDL